jgi:rod shape determining protein RodA
MLSAYILFNIGMTVGLTPVVGLPLPLFSYGGSSMLATMVAIGLLLNIQMRRFLHTRETHGGMI